MSLIGLVVSLAMAASAPAETVEPHGGLSCGGCHAAKEKIKPATARLLVASQSRHCGSCHQETVEVAHPVGFVPGRALPKEFPLNWKGEMTCSTCHGLHDGGAARLRGAKSGQDFCWACHDEVFFSAMRDQGHSLRASGHIVSSGAANGSKIDGYSEGCGECHQDRISTPNHDETTRGIPHRFGGLANHPVGAQYDVSAAVYGAYRPLSTLAPGVLLPDGKVSCLSCHQGYSREHGKLVAVEGSLCKHCHIK